MTGVHGTLNPTTAGRKLLEESNETKPDWGARGWLSRPAVRRHKARWVLRVAPPDRRATTTGIYGCKRVLYYVYFSTCFLFYN